MIRNSNNKTNLSSRAGFLKLLIVVLGLGGMACGSLPGELKTQLTNLQLVFEKTKLFQPKTGQIYLYHTQSTNMEIKGVKIVGEKASWFELIQSPTFPLRLESGTQTGKWLTLQFFSSQEGSFSAHVEVTYQANPQQPEQTMRIVLQAEAVSSANPARLQSNLTSNVVDFGTITTQDTLTHELILFNESDSVINIDQLKLVDNEKMAFKMPFPLPVPFRVFPNKENGRSVLLQAQIAETGTYEAWLLIASQNATNLTKEGTRFVKLKVEVVPYQQPGSVSFHTTNGQVYFKDVKANERKEQVVTLFNQGQLAAQILSIQIKGDTSGVWSVADVPTQPFALEGGGMEKGRDIKVVFMSSTPRPSNAQLHVEYLRDPKRPESKTQAGLGLQHDMSQAWYSFDCVSVDFGAVDKNQTVQRSCSLRSRGNIDLILRGVKFQSTEGKESHFKWTSPTVFPIQLSPNQRVDVTLAYTPAESNANDQGRWIPDTNILVDREEDRPALLVRGRSNR